MCQPRLSMQIQRLEVLIAKNVSAATVHANPEILSIPRALPNELSDYLGGLNPGIGPSFRVLHLCFLMEDKKAGLSRPSKYFFHRWTTSPVEVSSSPPAPQRVSVANCFPHLRRRLVCKNPFVADQKSPSMAFPNSSQAQEFFPRPPPELLPAWPACARPLCQVSHKPTGLERTPFALDNFWRPPPGSGVAAKADIGNLATTATTAAEQ